MRKVAFIVVLAICAVICDAKVVVQKKPTAPKKVIETPAQTAHKLKEAVVGRVGRWDAHDPGYYTDDFARRKMFPLAAATYADNPQDCLTRKFQNASVINKFIISCEASDKNELCAGYTAISHSEKAIVVAFRRKNRRRLVERSPRHSLGGSVASIAATYILNTYNLENERIKLVTFGQPRTGDTDFAAGHNLRLPRSYRVTHRRDIVPHIPPEKFENYWSVKVFTNQYKTLLGITNLKFGIPTQ
ncbi:Triacylglycerol lipase [Aphelenchoides besseyi]|nr:Triacylglycerol lipase [Aphelenchoides besseyi]